MSDAALQTALQHHQAGRFSEAERLYRKILAEHPHHADALHLLGLIQHRDGQFQAAADLVCRAIAIRPDWAEAHYNLGVILKDDNLLNEAATAFGRAIELRPNYAEAHGNLGTVLAAKGQHEHAANAFRRTIELRPTWHEAHNNLGVVLKESGHPAEAIEAFRNAVTLNPHYPEAHNNLGNALKDSGSPRESIAAYQRAIELRRPFPEATNNLGTVLRELGRLEEAIAACREALLAQPNFPEAWNNLGVALHEQGQLDEAAEAFQQAIRLRPAYAEAHYNFGNLLKDQGQLDHSITAYRQAIKLKPSLREAHNNLVYLLHFHPAYDSAMIAEELSEWNRQHAAPLKKYIQHHTNDRNPDRRLRIGYVSPDFREHPVGRFLLPLLAHHNTLNVEVFAYSNTVNSDALTGQVRSHVDHWRDIAALSDATAADLIREDGVDILVDLSIHMARNRLPLLARKPAPVQATYLAYCSTTGMETMDFRLSDPYLDPPELDESVYTERTIRLPDTYWCYEPSVAAPAVNSLPAIEVGQITFGCLNNFCKVTEPVLVAWANLMRAVPRSQLLLHARPGSHRLRVQEGMEKSGIDPARVRFADKLPMADYFHLYHGVDIALDTFPYGGGTTTCDALWMGVPVVSLAGTTAVGRGGLSILSHIDLPELVARSTEKYVQVAATLALDITRLDDLRQSLRCRMQKSMLTDAARFARNVENAYRRMWREWCSR